MYFSYAAQSRRLVMSGVTTPRFPHVVCSQNHKKRPQLSQEIQRSFSLPRNKQCVLLHSVSQSCVKGWNKNQYSRHLYGGTMSVANNVTSTLTSFFLFLFYLISFCSVGIVGLLLQYYTIRWPKTLSFSELKSCILLSGVL